MLRVFALVSLVMLLISGCGGQITGSADSQGEKVVKVGVLEPLTGAIAETGNWVANGVKLAIENINNSGGITINGEKYKIKPIIYDTATKINEAMNGINKLVSQDKVKFVLGTMLTDQTAAIMQVAEPNKVLVISSVSAGDKLTKQGWKYFFRAAPYNNMSIDTAIDVCTRMNKKKIAMLVSNDAWGKSYVSLFPPAMEKAGIEVVGIEYYELHQADYSTTLNKIKSLNPELVILGARTDNAVAIFQQAMQIMPDIPLYEQGGAIPEKVLEALGPEKANHLFFASRNGPEGEEVAKFKEQYKKKFGEEPFSFSYSGYDSVYILAAALEKAGTIEDTDKVREAMLSLKYKGLIGDYSFQPNGEVNLRGAIAYIEDGKVIRQWADQPLPEWLK